MNAITPFHNGPVTMSSREIAELCEKRHADVMRDIRVMLEQIAERKFALSDFEGEYKDSTGRSLKEYHLPKDLTVTLITGYRADLRYKVVKRLEELEAEKSADALVVPDFSDPAAAARAWADQYEARQIAERTKAEIGSPREATAMNTASQAVKRADKLAIELDRSQQYASVKRMQLQYHGQKFNWRELRSVSTELGLPPIDIFDANYGTVKAYHADAWRESYAIEIL